MYSKSIKIFIIIIMFMTFECYGQWSKSTLINTPVCIGYNADQSNLVQNGSLGTYVVWLDSRIGHVYAQYVNAKGVAQWKTNGIFICGQQGNQTAVHAINDGLGNFIITWYNSRDTVFDFYAQKITPEGIICWPTGGIKFASSKATLSTYNISSDSRGGVVIAYLSYIWPTYSPPYSLLVQRIDKNGSICWGNGKTIVDASYLQEAEPVLIPDGLKGVVLAWADHRYGGTSLKYYDIYSQRIDSSGNSLWQNNGLPICSADNDQARTQIASTSDGAFIITWDDSRNGGSNWDNYAQKVDLSGNVLWTFNGVPVCNSSGSQTFPLVASDNSGGAFFVWQDLRSGNFTYIYSQHLNKDGNMIWNNNSVQVCNYPAVPNKIILDEKTGDMVVCWSDNRNSDSGYDIFAQRIGSDGNFKWIQNGITICNSHGNQLSPNMITADNSSLIFSWTDQRNGSNDIYIQKILSDGNTPVVIESRNNFIPTDYALLQNYPNPFNPSTFIEYSLKSSSIVKLIIYDVLGREISTLVNENEPAGTYKVNFNAANFPSGIYIYRLQTNAFTQTKKMLLLK